MICCFRAKGPLAVPIQGEQQSVVLPTDGLDLYLVLFWNQYTKHGLPMAIGSVLELMPHAPPTLSVLFWHHQRICIGAVLALQDLIYRGLG